MNKDNKTELSRIHDLESYKILDTAPEHEFDRLTKLASYVCGTPIALISLIDSDRQWFKSNVGLDGVNETHRNFSFCTHAINQNDIFEVQDAEKDSRFAKNPFVTSDPSIKFYAGAPLTTPEGHNIGTLCVIDQKPKKLTPEQAESLKTLAGQVIELLELRKANKQLAEQHQLLVNKARLQSIGELAGGVCHQINNPLAIIVGRSMILRSQLKQKLAEDPDVLKELDVIDQTSQRISGILKALRMYAKDFGSDINLNSVNEIVDDAMTLIKGKLNSVKVNLHYDRGPEARSILNKNQISQVVLDLLNNAVEAMEETEEKELTVDVSIDDKNVYLSVKDTGKGIKDEDVAKVFDPFFSTKSRHFGIGLSNAKNFLNQHKGKIELLSNKGPTQFKVTLPRAV
jgi:two-component system, NtrC family, sensor kinase